MSHRYICARSLRRVVLCWQKPTRRLFHPFHPQELPCRILQPYRFVLKEYFGLCSCLFISETTSSIHRIPIVQRLVGVEVVRHAAAKTSDSTGPKCLLNARRNFANAASSKRRTRSCVTPISSPTCSSDFAAVPFSPKRCAMIVVSRSFNVFKRRFICSEKSFSLRNSNGVSDWSSEMVSQRAVCSSSLIGASSDAGRRAIVVKRAIFSFGIPSSSASSSSVGSRPRSLLTCAETRRIRVILSTTSAGKRIVLLWLTSARWIARLIHQLAYVLSLEPLPGSNRPTASIRPMFPSEIRSAKGKPRLT